MKRTRLTEADRKRQIIEATGAVASRDGLDATTVRAVATEAGVSHGLVLHHFGSMDDLHSSVLDSLLNTALVPQTDGLDTIPVRDQLMIFLTRQLTYMDDQHEVMDMLFEFWARGTRDPSIRDRIGERLSSFREAIEPITAQLVASDPDRFHQSSASALAITVGDLVLGYAMQQQIRPEVADRETLLSAIRALLTLDRQETNQ